MDNILKLNNWREMMRSRYLAACALSAFMGISSSAAPAGAPGAGGAPPTDGDFVIRDFHFASGESLPELRVHYTTLGKLHRDAHGRVDNAVLIMHGTGGNGRRLLTGDSA